MCTCPELMLSTYEKQQYKYMLGSKRIGGEELQKQGSVIQLVTRPAWKGWRKSHSSQGCRSKSPEKGPYSRLFRAAITMLKKKALLLTRGHNPLKEVLSQGSQSPTSSPSLGSQSLGRGPLSLVSFSLTLGYGGSHAYPASSGFSWPDAILQIQAEISI